MPDQLGYPYQSYLDLSLLHRCIRSNLALIQEEGQVNTDETFTGSILALEAAATKICQRFHNMQRSYLNGWMGHQAFKKELERLRLFLLTPELVSTTQLQFGKLIKTVNEFI